MTDTDVPSRSAAGLSLLIGIGRWRGALPLEAVDEVVRAVAITPLTGARGALLGYVDVRGDVCPVIDARRVFHLPPRAQRPSDRMVVLSVGSDRLVIPVDEASRVAAVRVADDVPSEAVAPNPSRTPAGLRAARVDELDGDIVALVDPVTAFGRFASGRSIATATEGASAPGP